MSDQVIETGDKLHIITRRLFEGDVRRHFVGKVDKVSGAICEVSGFSFVFHAGMNEYRKSAEARTRIFSLAEAGYVVNKIPKEVEIASLRYQVVSGLLVVTDGQNFALNINEFGPVN